MKRCPECDQNLRRDPLRALDDGHLFGCQRLRAEKAEARVETAEELLARAHSMLEGQSRYLVHEIAAFLGWESDSVGTDAHLLPTDSAPTTPKGTTP